MGPSSQESVSFISKAPHLMFWLSIPFVLIIGFSGIPQIELIWNDRGWIIVSTEFAFLISIVYLFMGLIYYAIISKGKPMRNLLTVLHLFCTLDLSLLFWVIYLFTREQDNGLVNIEISGFSEVLVNSIIIGQVFFLMQIISSIIAKPKL